MTRFGRYGMFAMMTVSAGLYAMTAPIPAAAADVIPHIDAARAYMQKGDVARSAHELEIALLDLQDRLGRSLSDLMPAPPSGWVAEEAEYEGLGSAGGGLTVSRAYTKDDASLNASLILDNPAVDEAVSQAPAQSATKKIKLGAEDAVLRWDASSHSGEITVVMAHRVLVQITGEGVESGETLTDLAKGIDFAKIRKVVGI